MIKNCKNLWLKTWCILSTFAAFSLILYIIFYIFVKGAHVVNSDFIFGVPKGMPPGASGGIFPAIIGSLYLALISGIFASVLAISTALYLVFYCENKYLSFLIHIVVQCTAGIPSIVLGLFGYTFFVLNLKLGISLLSAGITLGIMIFPFIEVRVEKILNEFPSDIIISSYALGISKMYTFFKLILPSCIGKISSSIALAVSLAVGATAPIMLTGVVINAPTPKSVLSPVMALPYHLYVLIEEGISVENAYGTAFVLLCMLLLLNTFAIIISTLGKDV